MVTPSRAGMWTSFTKRAVCALRGCRGYQLVPQERKPCAHPPNHPPTQRPTRTPPRTPTQAHTRTHAHTHTHTHEHTCVTTGARPHYRLASDRNRRDECTRSVRPDRSDRNGPTQQRDEVCVTRALVVWLCSSRVWVLGACVRAARRIVHLTEWILPCGRMHSVTNLAPECILSHARMHSD